MILRVLFMFLCYRFLSSTSINLTNIESVFNDSNFGDSVTTFNKVSELHNTLVRNHVKEDHIAGISNNRKISHVACITRRCVRKCCAKGKFMRGKSCVPLTLNVTEWTPDPIVPNYRLFWGKQTNRKKGQSCPIFYHNEFELLKDGNVLLYEYQMRFNYTSYCIDRKIGGNERASVFASVCFVAPSPSKYEMIMDFLHTLCLWTSWIFCGFILVLQGFVLKLKKIQEKCLFCMCLCLFSAFFILCLNRISFAVKNADDPTCIFIGVCQQFFFLALYFWLTVQCYEITRIITGTLKAIPLDALMASPASRFFRYSCLAWGCPLVISGITVLIQEIPSNFPKYLKPNIGTGRCWFKEEFWSLTLYFYGYQVSLHAINVILMARCLVQLGIVGAIGKYFPYRKNTPRSTHQHLNLYQLFRNQFFLLLLFVIVWCLDSLTLVKKRKNIWRFVEMLTSLQGFFLFLLISSSKKWIKLREVSNRLFRWSASRSTAESSL